MTIKMHEFLEKFAVACSVRRSHSSSVKTFSAEIPRLLTEYMCCQETSSNGSLGTLRVSAKRDSLVISKYEYVKFNVLELGYYFHCLDLAIERTEVLISRLGLMFGFCIHLQSYRWSLKIPTLLIINVL